MVVGRAAAGVAALTGGPAQREGEAGRVTSPASVWGARRGQPGAVSATHSLIGAMRGCRSGRSLETGELVNSVVSRLGEIP